MVIPSRHPECLDSPHKYSFLFAFSNGSNVIKLFRHDAWKPVQPTYMWLQPRENVGANHARNSNIRKPVVQSYSGRALPCMNQGSDYPLVCYVSFKFDNITPKHYRRHNTEEQKTIAIDKYCTNIIDLDKLFWSWKNTTTRSNKNVQKPKDSWQNHTSNKTLIILKTNNMWTNNLRKTLEVQGCCKKPRKSSKSLTQKLKNLNQEITRIITTKKTLKQ